MTNRDKHLSKTLSWLLRHGAVKEGLKISPEGYVSVEDILQHKSLRGKYTESDIIRVVSTNDKQRFQLRHNPDSVLEIKAHQGHTIQQVDESGLTPILQSKYKTVVHGTYSKCWPYIKDKGLSCMKRKHIHLAKGTLDDPNIISGIRKDIQIYIFIDLDKALADGVKFYESDNGVILTPGNAEGYLEPKYFKKVIEVNTGYPEYTQPQDLTRIFANYGTVKVDRINSEFAVLTFSDEDDAQEAVEDSLKVNIYGEFLTVKLYTPGEEESEDSNKGPNTPNSRNKPVTPKRAFIGSKQKGEIIEPQQICLEGDIHEQLDNLLRAVRLTQEEVTTLSGLYQDLEWVLQQQWPGCIACPFGSITTGLGIKSSDADCFIQVPAEYRHPGANFVNKAKRLLQQYPRVFAEVLSIPRANTPIVKFFHVPTRTHCDVTFKTPLGARNSKLIAFLLHADPRLIPMAVVIKYWAKVHGLSGTGKLTNYTLTMLIIFYLQQPPHAVLPSVEWLQRDPSNDLIVDYWNTGFIHSHDLLPRTTNEATIAELIGGFFEYYSQFDFDESIVCPFTGHPIKKDLFKDHNNLPPEFERYKRNIQERTALPLRFHTCICVQDPIEQSHNVASAINRRLAVDIKEYFKFAAQAYSTEKHKHCAGFLSTILLQKPKLPKRGVPDFRFVVFPHILECIIICNADWKSIVRKVMMQTFQVICKIPLTKVDETPKEEAKRLKEKYTGIVTKAIWKRKQFNKLYSFSRLNLLKKQTRITEEILNVEKETFKLKFQLAMSFSTEVRNVIVTVKLIDGDMVLFREFGKFFITNLQSWYIHLLKPYCDPQKSRGKSAVPNGSKTEGPHRPQIDGNEENCVDIKCAEVLQSDSTSSELIDVSLVNDINDINLNDSTLSNDTE